MKNASVASKGLIAKKRAIGALILRKDAPALRGGAVNKALTKLAPERFVAVRTQDAQANGMARAGRKWMAAGPNFAVEDRANMWKNTIQVTICQ
jgi:hypothetical protein